MYLFYLEIIECSGGKVRLLTLLMSVLYFCLSFALLLVCIGIYCHSRSICFLFLLEVSEIE